MPPWCLRTRPGHAPCALWFPHAVTPGCAQAQAQVGAAAGGLPVSQCWWLTLVLFFCLFPQTEKETFLDPFILRDLLPASLGSYYRYTGSLTTPPCSEIVEWIVFRKPVPISYHQVDIQPQMGLLCVCVLCVSTI